jgi:hypothetical protein
VARTSEELLKSFDDILKVGPRATAKSRSDDGTSRKPIRMRRGEHEEQAVNPANASRTAESFAPQC